MSKSLELTLPSLIDSVDEAATLAEKFARDNGFGDDVVSAIDLAVRESVANAVKHGNEFSAEKSVEVVFLAGADSLEIRIRDFGSGFSVESIPDPTDPNNLLSVSGRGILFMRSFMDVVEWSNPEDGGTMVRMVKMI